VLPEAERARAGAVQIHAFSMMDLDPGTRERLDLVELTIEERTRLRLSYEDEAGRRTGRTVRPLGLFFWGKVWTLVAWCELREDFRMFRVDRMASAEPGERFRPEKGRTLRDFYAREVPHEAWP
jgi:predicted DNA-binding transcriptional regulator YafY